MKRIALVTFVISIMIQGCTNSSNDLEITGTIQNSNHEYIYLAHQPLYRGNFNSVGFISVGDRVNNDGEFELISDKVVDGAKYWIEIKDNVLRLNLFKGDKINLNFDINNIDSTLFAYGKGAGKINVQRLSQFESKLWYDTIYTMDSYKSIIDSTITSQLYFLDLIYDRAIESEEIQNASNKQVITKIIKKTPLSEKEYEFLKTKISLQDLYYLGNFPAYLNQNGSIDSMKLDFSNSYFSCYNPSRYGELGNINDSQFGGCINTILVIEYLKHLQSIDKPLTYKDYGINDYLRFQ